jgi:hypothetical protein
MKCRLGFIVKSFAKLEIVVEISGSQSARVEISVLSQGLRVLVFGM